jgi:hypothetical protein
MTIDELKAAVLACPPDDWDSAIDIFVAAYEMAGDDSPDWVRAIANGNILYADDLVKLVKYLLRADEMEDEHDHTDAIPT